jgi:hypothetical protein
LTSSVSERSQALVAERLPDARGLGLALADLIDDPEAFVVALREGLSMLADDAYAAELARIAPTTSASVVRCKRPSSASCDRP